MAAEGYLSLVISMVITINKTTNPMTASQEIHLFCHSREQLKKNIKVKEKSLHKVRSENHQEAMI